MQGKLYSSPLTAAGSNWINPANALSLLGGYAEYPENATPTTWLSLTNWGNRAINDLSAAITGIGVTLYAPSVPPAATVNFGRVARVFRGNVGDMVTNAPEVFDLNGSTYYGDAATTAGTRVITVIHDFGALVAVDSAQISARTDSFAGWEFDSSNDGTTWTTVPRSGFGSITGGDWSDTYPATSAVTARYFRATISDDNFGSGQARIYEFKLYNGVTLLTPGYVGGGATPIRLEIALTKDGSTMVGTSKFVEVGTAGGVFELGGESDLWGTTVSEAEYESASFGFLIRRPQTVDSPYSLRRVDAVVRTVWFDFVPVPGMRPASLQNALLGKQADRDTRGTPTIRTRSFAIRPVPNNENKEFMFAGDLVGDFAVAYEEGQFSANFDPSFDEMGLLLASVVGKPVTSLVSTGVFRHTFNLNTKGQADPQFYTAQYGDVNHAEEALTAVVNAINLEWSGKRSMSGSVSGFTRRVDGTLTACQAGANCVQSIAAVTGAPTSFKLRFKGAETAAITVAGISNTTIQTALLALSTIGAGNVVVTGASAPFTVTFQGALAGVAQPLIEVASFVGGTAPTMPITMTTPGGYTEVPFTPILAGHISAFVSPTVAGLATLGNKVGTTLKGSFSLDGRYKPVEYTDAAQASFGAIAETDIKLVTKLTVNADDANGAFETDARNRADRFARIIATGADITVGNPYSLIIDMACRVSMIGDIKDEGDVVARDYELGARYDAAWGQAAQIVLINGVASY
jgi:hypothetical protein